MLESHLTVVKSEHAQAFQASRAPGEGFRTIMNNFSALPLIQRPHLSCHIFSPIRQETRGSLCAAGTTGGWGAPLATSCNSLVRIASLNFSRSLIGTTKEPGPPITQSS